MVSDLARGLLAVSLIVLGVAVVTIMLGTHPWVIAVIGGFSLAVAGVLILPPRR